MTDPDSTTASGPKAPQAAGPDPSTGPSTGSSADQEASSGARGLSGVAGSERGLVLLGLALALGLLRFVRLGEWSLWFDEVATWTDAHHGLDGGQINNKLGYWAIAWVASLSGGPADELGLRLLPAIVGWLVIPLTWFVFRPFFGGRAAAGAAVLVAVSTWQVSWSQTARFYTMAQAISLVGGGITLSGYVRASVPRAVLGLVVAASAFFFHPSGALLVPALVMAPWVVSMTGVSFRTARRPAYVLLGCSIVAVAAAFPTALETWNWYSMQKGHSGGLMTRLPSIVHYLKTTGFYVTPVLGLAALVGGGFALRRRSAPQLAAFAIAALGLAAALTASAFVRISAQYVFVTLPWLCMLACLPLVEDGHERSELSREGALLVRRMRTAWLLVLAVPALTTTALYLTVRRGERPAWREAYQYVWNERDPGDLVLGMEASVGEFYIAPDRTALRETRHVAWLDKFRALRAEQWTRHPRGTWYVINPEQLMGWKPEEAAGLRRYLAEECHLVKSFPLYVESRDLSVWVYVRA